MGLLKLLFSFDGRISRKPFWIYFLCLPALALLLHYLLRNSDATTQKNADLIFVIVFAYPSLAVQIKRWHDLNKSGGAILINLIPYVGMLWALVDLGFFEGTHGENRYGPDPLGRTAPATKIKTYIDSQTTPYLIEFFMFAVLPGGILLFLFRSVLKGDTISAILMTSLLLLLSLPFYFLFRWIRKYRAYKIETYDSGLTYHGLLKKIQSRWDDVLSVKTVNHGLSKLIQVETNQGSFYFPLTMKENNKEYPQIRHGMDDSKWEYEKGKVCPITVDKCALYVDIKNHVGDK